MGPPGWIVGPAVALGTLYFSMWLLALGMVGFLLAPVVAMWSGAAAASLVDSRRRLNTIVVVVTTIAMFAVYLNAIRLQPPPPGASRGGPNVYPPPGAMKGDANVPPR